MTFHLAEKLRFVPLALIGAVVGAGSVSLACLGLVEAPRAHDDLFQLVRADNNPLEITENRRLTLPYWFGDFDLSAEIELPTGSELDVVVRLAHPNRPEAERYHARYDVLRVSTQTPGPPFLTREKALFERPSPGGLDIAAGVPATVSVTGRGHRVRANVAGKSTPWIETVDDIGQLAFVLHGEGTALLRYLSIQPLQRPASADPWLWGGGVGAVLGLLFALFGVTVRRGAVALAALPAVALLGGQTIFSQLLPHAQPSLVGALSLALAGVPIALAAAVRLRLRGVLIAALGLVAIWEIAVRAEHRRFRAFEDPRLTAYFGRDSHTMPFDALTPQLDSAHAVHKPVAAAYRVLFAGGAAWFEAGGRRGLEHNLGALTAGALRALVGPPPAAGADARPVPVDGVVIPTVFGSVTQQFALLEDFLIAPFAPDVVEFAVSDDELQPMDPFTPRAALEGAVELPFGFGLELLRVWRRALQSAVPPGSATELHRVLDDLAVLAKRRGFAVALFRATPLGPELTPVFEAAAKAHGWPVLERAADEPALAAAERHAATLAPLLRQR